MQRCLASNGIRPINNLVDITNYVMEEYGQPMHAYDLDTIEGREIIVRRAKTGEKFVTLDGQEREMDDQVLMICDGERLSYRRYRRWRKLRDHQTICIRFCLRAASSVVRNIVFLRESDFMPMHR